jgi:hypothetical protein
MLAAELVTEDFTSIRFRQLVERLQTQLRAHCLAS